MTLDQWMKHVENLDELLAVTQKELAQVRATTEESIARMPFLDDERPLAACWFSTDEPEIATIENTIGVASQYRLIFCTAGGFFRSAWSYWLGLGGIAGLSLSEWVFSQSDNWGNHSRQNFIRMDIMLRNLDSITLYRQFEGPRDLVPLAKCLVPVAASGTEISNDSDDFLMAYNAVTSQ